MDACMQDPILINAFNNNADIHEETAKRVRATKDGSSPNQTAL